MVYMIAATIGCNGNRFMFSSGKDMLATPAEFGLSYADVWFDTRDGERLNAWLVPGKSNLPMVIFFHGNAANISSRVDILRYFNEIGFSVFIFDYRGFGRSQGYVSAEEDLYQDARSALDYIKTKGWSSSDMIYYGHSMGAAVSLQMGLESPPSAVVLECPFTNMTDIAWYTAPVTYALIGWWALDVQFDNINKIEKLSAPVVIFQGDKDQIVPLEMAQRLYQKARKPKALYVIPGGGHTDLYQVGGQKYRNAWLDLVHRRQSSRLSFSVSQPGSAAGGELIIEYSIGNIQLWRDGENIPI